jgi:hypothetical protein
MGGRISLVGNESMRILIVAGLVLITGVELPAADQARKVDGRVLDEKGNAVIGASVDFFWRANGPSNGADGKPIDTETKDGNKLFWANVGQMAPFRTVSSGPDGRFSIDVPGHFYMLMAIDAERRRGGLREIPKDVASNIEIRLHPLVRVKGTFEGPDPGKRPDWTHVCTDVPEDPTRPLQTTRLVSCGSYEARFEMSLPPGRYVLEANDDTGHGVLEKEIVVAGDKPEIDLGPLKLSQVTRKNINEKIKESQASGAMRDYKKHYGEKLPAWHIVDARGVKKDVQLSDFKGKWVLVNLWALNCGACLGRELPKLAKFYHEHQAQHDRFEILAVCVDCDEKMRSMADVDKELEPLVKYAWKEPLPFPILLDPSMITLERFGVPGYESILIDPEGKLVEGDEDTLARKLAEK